MGENDFAEVNRLAMEQVNKLTESGVVPSTVPYKSSRSSFWDEDASKLHSPYSPSASTGVPLYTGNTYRGSSYLGQSFLGGKYDSGVTETDRYYRKTLNAVYRTDVHSSAPPTQQTKDTKVGEKETEKTMHTEIQPEAILGESFSAKLLGRQDRGRSVGMRMVAPSIPISANTKHQMTAIFLSGLARMATTAVLSWSKEHQVPYELL